MSRLLAIVVLLAAAACSPPEGRLPPARPVPVEVEVVETAPFQPSLTLYGRVQPAETVALVAVHGGTVRYAERFAAGLATGAEVRRGETLASLDNERLRHELAEARIDLEAKSADLERARRSFDAGLVAEIEVERYRLQARLAKERLRTAEREAERATVKAPRDGRLIVDAAFAPGSEVAAGATLAELAVGDALRVEARAAASERTRLATGLGATLRTAAGAPAGSARVREVAAVVDAGGTVRVVLEVDGDAPAGALAAGLGVEVRVPLVARPDTITVPTDAVLLSGSGEGVFVVNGLGDRGKAERVAVTTGARDRTRVVILGGLSAGERVVVAGMSLLAEGTPVSVVERPRDAAATE